MAEAAEVSMLQMSVKNPNLPADIRVGFVKKVYGLLTTMLLISFGLASPFVFFRDDSIDFVHKNWWILGIAAGIMVIQYIFNLVMVLEMCCGGGHLQRAYLKMFVTVPLNYLYLFTFSVAFGVLLGIVCAQYSQQSVCFVFALTAGIFVSLTFYAACTKHDFTGWGCYICSFISGIVLFGVLTTLLVPIGWAQPIQSFIAAMMAIFFSWAIIHETQLIFGTARWGFNHSAAAKIEFTIDMYAFAAFQLYLDFIGLFLQLLRLLGQRRS